MIKWVFLVVVFVVNLSASSWAQQKKSKSSQYFVKVASENFRIAPKGKIIGRLQAGTKLRVLSEKGNWLQVQVVGWIWKPSVTTDSTDVVGFKMRAAHILVKTEAEALHILQQLRQGADFEELAKKYSLDPSARKGGDLGYFGKGELLKEFEEAVLKLKPGEISGVVKTPLGYHIIKRIE
ncbi:hypothetical protein DRQ15_03700 [candidate division KSB1 bacterium]|nr:MAG: hypothetical protein DRQ11_01735 [candidate division KSB1 bacterium]RKY91963.1 MAG: hypothetical protein DRQ15_03700 [candidate division KSB1 bacterium]HDI51475.1 hypothetical protein [Bacteroidota bacterium]